MYQDSINRDVLLVKINCQYLTGSREFDIQQSCIPGRRNHVEEWLYVKIVERPKNIAGVPLNDIVVVNDLLGTHDKFRANFDLFSGEID